MRDSPIVAGETLSVALALVNEGGAAGSTDVEWVAANGTVDTETVSLSLDTDADNPESLSLSAEGSTTPHGTIVNDSWSIGGAAQTGETVTTTFDDPGEVTVEATVTSAAGSFDTLTATGSVTEPTLPQLRLQRTRLAVPRRPRCLDPPPNPPRHRLPVRGTRSPDSECFAALVALLVSTLLYRVRD